MLNSISTGSPYALGTLRCLSSGIIKLMITPCTVTLFFQRVLRAVLDVIPFLFSSLKRGGSFRPNLQMEKLRHRKSHNEPE